MTDAKVPPPAKPGDAPLSRHAEAARAARLAREAAALRDNLRRRKQQAPPVNPPVRPDK